MIRFLGLFLLLITALTGQNCAGKSEKAAGSGANTSAIPKLSGPLDFNSYWNQGKAELSTYEVTQERYGELRPAEQVNIFVTEDFSREKQVKLDTPDQAGNDRVPVLKLNSVRRFHTGIYDYSVLQSVFTPIDGSATLKLTCSVQDWCGHVFTQFNMAKNEYRIRQFSYFEAEGDSDQKLPLVLLEDDLWSHIRLHPDVIRLGRVQLIPATLYLRFRHQPFAVHTANLTIEKGERENTLRVVYEDIQRSLSIRFEPVSPYRILGWEEMDKGKLMSKGNLKTTRMESYWSEHDIKSDGLRDSMQVHF
ncbi:MAG: hypothetical protein ABIQ93_14135 [Saprospiraceae bacterium]